MEIRPLQRSLIQRTADTDPIRGAASMSVGTICTRKVITIGADDDLAAAAACMRENHVGYLVVTEPFVGLRTPVGVLTDRDIVIKVMAKGVDPGTLTDGDTMTRDPLVVKEGAEIAETLQKMRGLGVRRVPVVGTAGELAGVLSLDDVVDHLVGQLANIAGSMRNAQRYEQQITR